MLWSQEERTVDVDQLVGTTEPELPKPGLEA